MDLDEGTALSSLLLMSMGRLQTSHIRISCTFKDGHDWAVGGLLTAFSCVSACPSCSHVEGFRGSQIAVPLLAKF